MSNVFMRARQASQFLGCSKSKLYKLTMKKEIPFYKVGGTLYFKESELISFIENGIITPPTDEIDKFDLLKPLFKVA